MQQLLPFVITLFFIPILGWLTEWLTRKMLTEEDQHPEYPRWSTVFSKKKQLVVLLVLTEASTALLWWRFGVTPPLWAALLLVYGLAMLSVVDYHSFCLPDVLTKPLVLLGLGVNYFELYTPMESAVIGAVAGYAVPWLINFTFKKLRGKEGMGQGDFKLLAALGAWAGWQVLPLILFIAALLGLVFALATKVGKGQPFPFGPALALSGFICLCYGAEMLAWYMGLLAI